MIKSKLPPQSGCSLEAVEPHPQKAAIKFFILSFVHYTKYNKHAIQRWEEYKKSE